MSSDESPHDSDTQPEGTNPETVSRSDSERFMWEMTTGTPSALWGSPLGSPPFPAAGHPPRFGNPEQPSAESLRPPSVTAHTWWKRHWRRCVRWGFVALVAIVLALEIVLSWDHLTNAWTEIRHARWGWLVACFVVTMVSMDSFAQVQRVLLGAAEVKVRQRDSLGLILAANAVSQSLPGGQVLAPAMVYRETRRWGASAVVAAWQVVMSGLLMGAGLAVLALTGTMLAGAKTSPFSVITSATLLIVFFALAQYVATHPDGVFVVGRRILGWVNNIRDRSSHHGVERWREILEQLTSVRLRTRDGVQAFGWSLVNWVTDVAALGFACYAVGGHPGIAAMCGAYAALKAVGSISPIPAGLGLVETALAVALTAAGMEASSAVAATIIYRAITLFAVVAIGWIVFVLFFRHSLREATESTDEIVTPDEPGALA